jgi:hypothetical protein
MNKLSLDWDTLRTVGRGMSRSLASDAAAMAALLDDVSANPKFNEDLRPALEKAVQQAHKARTAIERLAKLLEPIVGPDGDTTRTNVGNR